MNEIARALSNAYGFFDPESLAFEITHVLTPRPWVNVLANRNYGAVISQIGGGFSWYENCQIFRLSRWEQDLATDAMGRFLYLRDLDVPETVWSTTWQPTRRAAEKDHVQHGLGFTTYVREFAGLRTEHTVFVPTEDPCEVWLVRVSDLTGKRRKLRFGTYLDWHLGGVGDWHREFHRLFIETRAEESLLLVGRHPGLAPDVREIVDGKISAVLGVNGVGPIMWITDKRAFLGPLGDLARPAALFVESLAQQSTTRWDDPVGCGLWELELDGASEARFAVVLGATTSHDECRALVRRYDVGTADAALTQTKSYWRALCNSAAVQTTEPAIDVLCNAWLPYQAVAGRMLARCGYYQQSGAYGYRDQLQDSLVFLLSEPKRTLEQVLLHAEQMYEDGGVRHWWHPGRSIYAVSKHSDSALWLPYATVSYLDETADLGSLQQEAGYLSRNTQCPVGSGTLLEHCLRAIDRSLNRLSPRGLPLIEAGDWNDGLSHAGIEGKGESVWLAMFLYDILRRFQPYLRSLGEEGLAKSYAQQASVLQHAVNEWGWEGDRYVAGYRDDGAPFGSGTCEQGALYLNPQTWAVISGIAPADRAAQALKVVRENLLQPYGALLLRPAYRRLDPFIGYLSRYAPGLRENGGVYCHAATWAVQAFAMLGDTETALDLYLSLCPPLRAANDPDLYAAEPYVMPGNVDGPDSPHEGRAGWTWYTGSAAWMKRVAFDWLLGVRAEFEGLRVRPVLPAAWDGFAVRRPFRGDVFDIRVRRTPGVGGEAVADLLLISTGSGKVHRVDIP